MYFKPKSNVWAKHYTDSTLGGVAAVHVTRIRPECLYHNTFVTWLTLAMNFGNLTQLNAILREETSMTNHYFLVDNVAQR